MMHRGLLVRQHPEVARVIRAAFPAYRKQKFSIGPFYPMRVNSEWSGGSRDYFAVVNLVTLERYEVTVGHCYFDVASHGIKNIDTEVVTVDRVGNVTLNVLPEGFALVSCGIFCGKPGTAAVYVNPANLTKFLPGSVTP